MNVRGCEHPIAHKPRSVSSAPVRLSSCDRVMDRRTFLGILAGGLLAAPLATEVQQAGKVWRIGFLGVASAARFESFIEAVRLGLREQGYIEGKNVTIEFRWAEGHYDRLPALATELVRLNLDVIITHGTPGTLALKRATSTIPIVMAIIGDPIEAGAVASLVRPGGNITGSSFFSDEVTAKRLDILKTALPGLARVGALANPDNPATSSALKTMDSLAQAHKLKIEVLKVRRLDELDAMFAETKSRPEALVVPDEQLFTMGDSLRRLAEFCDEDTDRERRPDGVR
jgi:putative ABC transport system substrate-binding protein